jgi:hypothetical protein
MNIKEKLSTLWIVVMFNMLAADIFSIFVAEGIQISQELLLIGAVMLEIPVLMIFLSRVIDCKINRWLNITASVITILFVVGGGSLYLHYLFFASVEVICMLFIIKYAWNWKKNNGKESETE